MQSWSVLIWKHWAQYSYPKAQGRVTRVPSVSIRGSIYRVGRWKSIWPTCLAPAVLACSLVYENFSVRNSRTDDIVMQFHTRTCPCVIPDPPIPRKLHVSHSVCCMQAAVRVFDFNKLSFIWSSHVHVIWVCKGGLKNLPLDFAPRCI